MRRSRVAADRQLGAIRVGSYPGQESLGFAGHRTRARARTRFAASSRLRRRGPRSSASTERRRNGLMARRRAGCPVDRASSRTTLSTVAAPSPLENVNPRGQRVNCRQCGGPLPRGSRTDRLYCCASCRVLACRARKRSPSETRRAARRAARRRHRCCRRRGCRKVFIPRRKSQRYCSKNCRACETSRRYRVRHPQPPKPVRPCVWCGGPINPERRADAKYCSPLCVGRAAYPRSTRYQLVQNRLAHARSESRTSTKGVNA